MRTIHVYLTFFGSGLKKNIFLHVTHVDPKSIHSEA